MRRASKPECSAARVAAASSLRCNLITYSVAAFLLFVPLRTGRQACLADWSEQRAFGYDFFEKPSLGLSSLDLTRLSPDYVLAPGDVLKLSYWNDYMEERTSEVAVSPQGQIALPLLDSFAVGGLTLVRATALCKAKLESLYRKVRVRVALTKVHEVWVSVLGEVKQPGKLALNPQSTAFDALCLAGGPSRSGSMRHIRVLRGDKEIRRLDVYRYLMTGSLPEDVALQPGDSLFVPVVGPQVFVEGDLARPALYELAGGERLRDIVEMAGGVRSASYRHTVQVRRGGASGGVLATAVVEELLSQPDHEADVAIHGGDHVIVTPEGAQSSAEVAAPPARKHTLSEGKEAPGKGEVTVSGAVRRPGKYPMHEGMRLKGLLEVAGGLLLNHAGAAEVSRTTRTGDRIVLSVDVDKLTSGDADAESQNVMLQADDNVVVPSGSKRADLPSMVVTLEGEVNRPGRFVLQEGSEKLSELLARAGGLTSRAFPEGAVLRRKTSLVLNEEQAKAAAAVTQEPKEASAPRPKQTATPSDGGAKSAVEPKAPEADEKTGTEYVRVAVDFVKLLREQDTSADVVLRDGDQVIIPPIPNTISIFGAVMQPLAVLYEEKQTLDYYVDQAGGYRPDALKAKTVIIRANGKVFGREKVQFIERGDVIVVPPKAMVSREKKSWFETFLETSRILGGLATTLIAIDALGSR